MRALCHVILVVCCRTIGACGMCIRHQAGVAFVCLRLLSLTARTSVSGALSHYPPVHLLSPPLIAPPFATRVCPFYTGMEFSPCDLVHHRALFGSRAGTHGGGREAAAARRLRMHALGGKVRGDLPAFRGGFCERVRQDVHGQPSTSHGAEMPRSARLPPERRDGDDISSAKHPRSGGRGLREGEQYNPEAPRHVHRRPVTRGKEQLRDPLTDYSL